ncbi:MAG: tryptophan synthase subunit alpha [Candidatus Woesearchaeota archaeon]|nr:tryptophan synthase subunit alpha [Candidatus Woesearchaeota archaeon]
MITKKNTFMAHVYAGDPDITFTETVIRALDVDILELGIPFSDPIADGPVFQHACQRALQTTPDDVFALVQKLRKTKYTKPIVLTTYYNIIFRAGIERFVARLAEHRIQGLIVPDLPMEEAAELADACNQKSIHYIYLITPTTTDTRIKAITAKATGFIYLVSTTGVTGTSKGHEVTTVLKKIRACSTIPVLLGFGISKPEDIRGLDIDGFIVGSHICKVYQKDPSLQKLQEFVTLMKAR